MRLVSTQKRDLARGLSAEFSISIVQRRRRPNASEDIRMAHMHSKWLRRCEENSTHRPPDWRLRRSAYLLRQGGLTWSAQADFASINGWTDGWTKMKKRWLRYTLLTTRTLGSKINSTFQDLKYLCSLNKVHISVYIFYCSGNAARAIWFGRVKRKTINAQTHV